MKRILVVGSVNVDSTLYVEHFPKDGETIGSLSSSTCLGGKGANQAVSAAKLGGQVTLLCSLGDDSNGEYAKKVLSTYPLKTAVKPSKLETGSAYILVNSKGENQIVVNKGANAEIHEDDVITYRNLIKEADIVVLQMEISINSVMAFAKTAHELGKIVILNPAPFKELPNEIYPYLDFITPNRGELEKIIHEEVDSIVHIEKAMKDLLKLGVKNVITTLGGDGSIWVSNDLVVIQKAFSVTPIDTVGAGDCFNGSLAFGLASGLSIEKSLNLASMASSIAVTRKGAIPSFPTFDEIKKAVN